MVMTPRRRQSTQDNGIGVGFRHGVAAGNVAAKRQAQGVEYRSATSMETDDPMTRGAWSPADGGALRPGYDTAPGDGSPGAVPERLRVEPVY
jgi:hypothetical protein